jgi:uncharacterized protein YjaZ
MGNEGRRLGFEQLEMSNFKVLVTYEKELEDAVSLVKEGMAKSEKLLISRNDIAVILSTNEDTFIRDRMDGVFGFTRNDFVISISINTGAHSWRDFVAQTIAHEYNHAVRFQRMSGRERSGIGAGIAFEGLAQCFEEAATGKVRPWSTALNMDQAKEVWQKITDRLDDNSVDLYNRLFISPDDKEFALWSGYALGYLIIKERLKEGGNTDWERLVDMDSKSLIGKGL